MSPSLELTDLDIHEVSVVIPVLVVMVYVQVSSGGEGGDRGRAVAC